MIFQEPMTSLNPVFTIGDQLTEAIVLHQNVSQDEAVKRAIRLLELTGIPSAKERIENYPHQLSGGMRAARYDCDGHQLQSQAVNCR